MKKIISGLCMLVISMSAIAAEVAPTIDLKSCAAPVYPKASLMNEETGSVTLAFLVSPDGKSTESKVEKSSGSKSLDKTALAALSLCKFKPGTKDGKAESMWGKVNFDWKLD